MRDPLFRIGDTVRIKDYDTLRRNYNHHLISGLYGDESHDNISANGVAFVHDMKYLCGQELKILNITVSAGRVMYKFDSTIQQNWVIEEYMLEEIIPDEPLNDVIHEDFLKIIQ